ncbi:unnamed protein product [Diatraea saccharalis]|uniref:Uncharacterized protein n=1 Tax=Diatraea saccharalis TaxID=40085 RepID=A0A9N9R400_9NEOP|nr:unnamed protein product [Diatraea saccharalis]
MAMRTALLCAVFLFHYANAELRGRCPAEEGPCPARATPCNSDDECGEQICCSTTCGRACIDPLYTGCENVRLSSERISRALAAENSRGGRGLLKAVRTPRCRTSDGEFEEIQCDNEIVSSCWCVDAAGFEVPGTRAPAAGLVNCTRVSPCAAHTCRMLCPLGFELDARGCPLCKCRDPCASVTCPGQLSCQLEETPCLRPPCPPVPTCKRGRSLQNICPAGEPLLISETSRPYLCGTDPGKPNCPPLYRCLVESGNDYGVCCPASLELQKAGTCPEPDSEELECGAPCAHDLECPSMQKCCDGGDCGRHCTLPHNVTMCTQQKMLAELLVVSEREGKGYVPQCANDGSFQSRQCSRNGLVCWCVDSEGNKLRGSMGPSPGVQCPSSPRPARSGARSLTTCSRALCAGVCEYGYRTGADGCPTCECDDPCAGFPCPDGEECVRVRDAECSGDLCTGYPVCRPKVSYENPCDVGVPATDEEGSVIGCDADLDCPGGHSCTSSRRSSAAVCCPENYSDNSTDSESTESNLESCSVEAEALCGMNTTISCPEGSCGNDLVCCSANCGPICVDPAKMRLQTDRVDDTPTMCEYLRDFDEKMEGTVDGMKLALPPPSCQSDGSFAPQQCANGRCWCVDSFGTEIPETSTNNASSVDCDKALALHTAAESGSPPSWTWVPTCKDDGSYETVQCKGTDKTCWCVDSAGNEIAGTRTSNSTPNCNKPAECPAAGCNEEEICVHGRELDSKGCPTCVCRDPCSEAKCREDETCELVPLDCEGEFCPPLARCAPSPQCPDGGTPLLAPGGTSALSCGPRAAACPSTHACRFAPHDSTPAVCCPKPRTVCFESKDEGACSDTEGLNATRWHFNHERNRCERFKYHGCSGNHNNFRTKEECNAVCPVLSPCERLREKNEAATQKYGKGTFIPVCDESGAWESVQCMAHIDVCWCVSARGEPLKGSLVRGAKPSCNFRQARKWVRRDPLDERARADEVLEELIRQMTAYRMDDFNYDDEEMDIDLEPEAREPAIDTSTDKEKVLNDDATILSEVVEPKVIEVTKNTEVEIKTEKSVFKTKCQLMQDESENGGDGPRPRCLSDGSFSPRQCSRGRCWCVDAAGQRRTQVGSVPDLPDPDPCEPTQIESALLELEFVGVETPEAERARSALTHHLSALGARVPVSIAKEKTMVKLRATLTGARAVDVVYNIEKLVKQEKLSGKKKGDEATLGADVIRSEYRLSSLPLTLHQREILTESTVSAATSYHTALIVLAATSAFIISVLCVLVMLYRARLQREPHKAERFLPAAPPVYVLSADEKAELARVLHAPPPPVPPQNIDDNTRV